MEDAGAPTVLGVVVVHKPGKPVVDLEAVSSLAPQVDELLIVVNGDDEYGGAALGGLDADDHVRVIAFPVNRGTAAAWNAALAHAVHAGHRYLYLLDQDSVPAPDAVVAARKAISDGDGAAVVQPPFRDTLALVPFPWNTVASGSLYRVAAIDRVGGFDERLFVDEVDHEILARLLAAGHTVHTLREPTIRHEVGSPRDIRLLGRRVSILGHSVERHRLRGHSVGVLVRRYARRAPATAASLVLREAVISVKDVAAGERPAARALLKGLLGGLATGRPPTGAAERACPYCRGPLLGRFAAVEDWIFRTGPPADVYVCGGCEALAAGRVPADEELASWYSDYFTHGDAPPSARRWSPLWPTPRRRKELAELHAYFTPLSPPGRFLDVGCGTGERLVRFADAGWEVVGQDVDPRAGRRARGRGLTVHSGPLEDLVGREAPFDLIGMSHVLEHVADPESLLEACRTLLAPDGRLCVVAPNAQALGRRLFGRWWYGLDQPRHLAVPTAESIDRLTSRLGFAPLRSAPIATRAAILLGGSLARPVERSVWPAPVRRGAALAMHLLGQGMGRVAVTIDDRLAEELVWIGRRRDR